MRRTTVLLAAAATAVLALPLPASAVRSPVRSAPQVPYTGPTLTSVKLSTGAVSVKGLDTVPVTVTVTASGDQDACPRNAGGVGFRRTSTHVWDRSATRSLIGPLSCVTDNGGVRTYKAIVPVPSTADGRWRVDNVVFGNTYYLDPRTFGLPDAALAVTGTHRPRLRISVAPQPLPYWAHDVTVTVRASFDDTRAPVTTRWISVTDDGGSLGPCGECRGNTDAHGRIIRRLTLSTQRMVIADMPLSAAGFYDAWPSYSATFAVVVAEPEVSASPAKSRVPHGTNVGVEGRAVSSAVQVWYFTPRIVVNLQRLVGRHWRTVSKSTIRPNGRFTLPATPPKGRNLYRVSLPAQQELAASTSGTFLIRGT
jgi:hypothetical protein